jgi:hypothetical protein
LDRIESRTGPVERDDPYAAAGQAFVDEVRALLGDRPPDLDAVRRGALAAVAEQAWSERLGNLLDTQDVVKILGVTKQRISTLVSERRLVALPVRGRARFPAWQFALPAPEDRECLASAHDVLVRTGFISPWSAASWFQGAHGELEGVDPVTYLKNGGDRAHLLRVAERDATRLSR